MEEVGIEPGQPRPEPGARYNPNGNAGKGDADDQLYVMNCDGYAGITKGFEKADLFTLQRNKPGERYVDEEGGNQKKYWLREGKAPLISSYLETSPKTLFILIVIDSVITDRVSIFSSASTVPGTE